MAQRMKVRGALGCVVGGRVRDLAELKESQLPVCLPISPLVLRHARPPQCKVANPSGIRSGEINGWGQRGDGGICSQPSNIGDRS